jgi:hypothetical protein
MGATQGTTVPDNGPTEGGLGKSNTTRLNTAYASSPVITEAGNCTDDGSSLKEWYQANVLDGEQDANTLMGTVNMDYKGAPTISNAKDGTSSTVISGYVPNTASPGEGNGASATAIPVIDPVPGHEGDLGSITSPSETSSASGNGLLTSPQTTGNAPAAS